MNQTGNAGALLTARMVWAAQLIASLSMVGIFQWMRSGGQLDDKVPPEPIVFVALASTSCLAMLVGLVLPGRMYRIKATELAPQIAELPREQQIARLGPSYLTMHIVGLALTESMVVTGFVCGLLGFSSVAALSLMGCGALMMLLRFPTESALLAPLDDRSL